MASVGAVLAGSGAAAFAATTLLPPPKTYVLSPERSCRSISQPNGQVVAKPGRPGLSATALSKFVVRVDWRVAASVPSRCRVWGLMISAGPYRFPDTWRPITVSVYTHGRLEGSVRVNYPSTGSPPNVAIATAVTRTRSSSDVAAVRIRR